MHLRSSLASAAAAVVVLGLLCSQWCDVTCAFSGCSEPAPVVAAEHSAPPEHCHGHHAPGPESIPASHHHSPGCQHQHVVVAALPTAGFTLGAALKSSAHAIAGL